MSTRPKILIINPPPPFAFVPESGAACIVSHLRHNGFAVDMIDLGIRSLRRYLDELAEAPDTASRGGEALRQSLLAFKKDFTSLSDYRQAIDRLEVSRKTALSSIPQLELAMGATESFTWKTVHEHPLLEIAVDLLTEAQVETYPVVLFSVTHPNTFPVSVLLSQWIRKQNEKVTIVFGGAYVSVLVQCLADGIFIGDVENTLRIVDYLVPKMGEATICSLLRLIFGETGSIESGFVVSLKDGAPNVIDHYEEPSMDELHAADFSDYDLSAYFTPRPLLPLRTNTKCFWGKCCFCRGVGETYSNNFTQRSAMKILNDMLTYSERHGTNFFVLAEDATTARLVTGVSELLLERGVTSFQWGAKNMRFESSITESQVALWAEAGFRQAAFGLESGSPAMLRLYEKGIDLDHAGRVVRWFAKYGILAKCYVFRGHPDERADDIRKTIEFLSENRPYLYTFSYGTYFKTPFQLDFNRGDVGERERKMLSQSLMMVPEPGIFYELPYALDEPWLAQENQIVRDANWMGATLFHLCQTITIPRHLFPAAPRDLLP